MKPVIATVYYLTIASILQCALILDNAHSMCLRTMNVSGGEDHTMVLTRNGSVFILLPIEFSRFYTAGM